MRGNKTREIIEKKERKLGQDGDDPRGAWRAWVGFCACAVDWLDAFCSVERFRRLLMTQE